MSDISTSYFELAQTIIAYILMKTFHSKECITCVLTKAELKDAFDNMLSQISRHIRLPLTISEVIKNTFDIALTSLYPIFVVNDNMIYFLHPLIFNFLHSKPVFKFILEDKEKLTKLLQFIEKMSRELDI
ncbi:MAG: hypothetical protein QW341_05020 [Candidatus Bathyarchaeia archaeon]